MLADDLAESEFADELAANLFDFGFRSGAKQALDVSGDNLIATWQLDDIIDKLAEGKEQVTIELGGNQGERRRCLRNVGGKRCERLRVFGAVAKIENEYVSIFAGSVTEVVITPR